MKSLDVGAGTKFSPRGEREGDGEAIEENPEEIDYDSDASQKEEAEGDSGGDAATVATTQIEN